MTGLCARYIHIWRALPWSQQRPFVEELDGLTRQTFLRLAGESHLSPLQWDVAALPLSLGGLALPEMEREAALARAAALMTLPRSPLSSPALQEWTALDVGGLTGALQPRLDQPMVISQRRLTDGTPRLAPTLLVHHVSDNSAERSSRVLPVLPQLWPLSFPKFQPTPLLAGNQSLELL